MWKDFEKKRDEDVSRGLSFNLASEMAINDFLVSLKVSLEQVNYTVFRLQTDPPPLKDAATWKATYDALPEAYQLFQKSYEEVCTRWDKAIEDVNNLPSLDRGPAYEKAVKRALQDCKKLDKALSTLFEINGQAIFALHYAAFQNFINN